MDQLEHRIGGKPFGDAAGRTADVFNPATGAVAARVPLASGDVVDQAVKTATEAARGWSRTAVTKRQSVMFSLRNALETRGEDLAHSITSQHGKTLDDARGEVRRGIEVVEHLCGLPELMKGAFSHEVATAVDITDMRQPLGVCAGITPFNFPVMVPLWMAPVAIAVGNAFILKPSERDPSPSLVLAEAFAASGVPDGVFNVVHGDKETVDALLEHPGIAAISFVGSTPVARAIYEGAARTGKRVQALGGAKNHMVVLPDADMDEAADAAISAGYGSAGERCMAISVVVAVGNTADELVPRIAERSARLKVGDGAQPGVDMGPLITGEHRERVAEYVRTGLEEGADLVVDGRDITPSGGDNGFFLGPSLFDNVTSGMSIYTDEIFGPVLAVVRCDDMQQALDLIAANPYGNGVALFTRSGEAARAFTAEVEAGMVGINLSIPVPLSFHSFGGWDQSLFGDRHIYGPEGLGFYTRSKVVTSRWRAPARGPLSLGFPSGSGVGE